jgi:hypothetical protein
MKKQESSDTYQILCEGRIIYKNLSQDEMFDIMDDLAEQFIETGLPKPEDIMVECISTKEI